MRKGWNARGILAQLIMSRVLEGQIGGFYFKPRGRYLRSLQSHLTISLVSGLYNRSDTKYVYSSAKLVLSLASMFSSAALALVGHLACANTFGASLSFVPKFIVPIHHFIKLYVSRGFRASHAVPGQFRDPFILCWMPNTATRSYL